MQARITTERLGDITDRPAPRALLSNSFVFLSAGLHTASVKIETDFLTFQAVSRASL